MQQKIIRTGVIGITLVLCINGASPVHARMPFTETINTVPSGEVEAGIDERGIDRNGALFRREAATIGLGILSNLTVWYQLHYLHRMEGFANRESQLGDSWFKIWYYWNDFLDDRLHVGFLASLCLPTGIDAYQNDKWRGLSFGNNELRLGPVVQGDVKPVYFHLNLFYAFRQGRGENFYKGFFVNPSSANTIKKVFGFNFMSRDTFFARSRTINDYAIVSVAANTDAWHPLVPFVEFYLAQCVNLDVPEDERIPLEGPAINPRFVSLGFRYFFFGSAYGGIYVIQSLNAGATNRYRTIGCEISWRF